MEDLMQIDLYALIGTVPAASTKEVKKKLKFESSYENVRTTFEFLLFWQSFMVLFSRLSSGSDKNRVQEKSPFVPSRQKPGQSKGRWIVSSAVTGSGNPHRRFCQGESIFWTMKNQFLREIGKKRLKFFFRINFLVFFSGCVWQSFESSSSS